MTETPRLFRDVLPSTLDAVSRGGIAASQAALPPSVRALHRVVLRAFLRTGEPPSRQDLEVFARDLFLASDEAIGLLADADLMHTSPNDGRVSVAYPLSGGGSPHQVRLGDGPALSAMCAIDALGIPLMTAAAGVIESRDPATGQQIRIEHSAPGWRWEPATAVVVLATDACSGRIADACLTTAFHTDATTAADTLSCLDTGQVLSQTEAIAMAEAEFGPLLREDGYPR